MARFQANPAVVDTIQYDGVNMSEIAAFISPNSTMLGESWALGQPLFIESPRADLVVDVGDVVLRYASGLIAVHDPEQFIALFSAAEEAT